MRSVRVVALGAPVRCSSMRFVRSACRSFVLPLAFVRSSVRSRSCFSFGSFVRLSVRSVRVFALGAPVRSFVLAVRSFGLPFVCSSDFVRSLLRSVLVNALDQNPQPV